MEISTFNTDLQNAFLKYIRFELYRSEHTVTAYRHDLNEFLKHIEQKPVTDIVAADIRGWIASRGDAGITPRSLRRNIQSLRAFYRFLCRHNLMKFNPAADIILPKVASKLPEFARETEIEALIEELPENSELKERDAIILTILYSCGLRQAELLSLTDNDIDFFRQQLTVTGKRRKTRIIPLPSELCDKIRHWQASRDEIFPDLPHPKPVIATIHGHMNPRTLYSIVNRLLQSTHTSRKSPHTLRHTFATSMLNAGADINSIKELLGHASLDATQIYTHVSFADMKRDWSKAHPRAKVEKR